MIFKKGVGAAGQRRDIPAPFYNMEERELLKYALEHGMINVSYVQEQINMTKRDELLKKHPYEIWEGKDKRWRTYVPDKKSKTGRALRSRSTQREMEDYVVEYWKEMEKNPTIKDLYIEWSNDKLRHGEICMSTKNRYDRQYKESMQEFGERRIKDIDEDDVEEFIRDAIKDSELTVKGYGNLKTIIYGIFKRAKRKKMVSFSIKYLIADIEISRKVFRKVEKSDEELVFMNYEMPKIISYFKTRDLDIKDLGIWLIFYTGLRPGELAGLKWEDVDDNVIHVNRTEIHYEDENNKKIYEVRDFPKTAAGIRDVFIPSEAQKILERIRELNPDGEYVFENNGKRIRTYLFDDRIRLICERTNIVKKSQGKARKTYGSLLVDSHVDESLIISQMGHTDIKTTKKYYYKNRKSQEQKAAVIKKVFENDIND